MCRLQLEVVVDKGCFVCRSLEWGLGGVWTKASFVVVVVVVVVF